MAIVALIWSLGCEATLNVLTRWRRPTRGTLNLSHRSGSYDERHIASVQLVAQLAMAALPRIART